MGQGTGVGDKPIVIRISEELHAALKKRAEEEERPVAQVMRPGASPVRQPAGGLLHALRGCR